MRQPDIEIYLRDADHRAIADWLSQAIGPCSAWQSKGQTFKCKAGDIPVTWVPNAAGKWHSLYLESDATPWEDDLSCARAAHAALGVEIRCATGGWQEGDEVEDDRWIRIAEDGENEIVWRTS
jgi:hypothetical protein